MTLVGEAVMRRLRHVHGPGTPVRPFISIVGITFDNSNNDECPDRRHFAAGLAATRDISLRK